MRSLGQIELSTISYGSTSAFLNTEYYLVRLSNQHPALVGQMLEEVLEPEDRERYAGILRFLDHQARAARPEASERESNR